jgi:hypothetical protein
MSVYTEFAGCVEKSRRGDSCDTPENTLFSRAVRVRIKLGVGSKDSNCMSSVYDVADLYPTCHSLAFCSNTSSRKLNCAYYQQRYEEKKVAYPER